MKHLFVINPAVRKTKGKVAAIKDGIISFFKDYPDMRYDFYVSEWCRDAVPYIRRYIMAARDSGVETVRVHAIGGTGTLFEVVNGVVGLDGVQVAAHPYGKENTFLQYFGYNNIKLFSSMKNQVFGATVPVDVIRCGNNCGMCYGMAGLEAHGNALGDEWVEKGIPGDISYVGAAISKVLKDKTPGQRYRVDIDGIRLDGDYTSILVANTPCYGDKMSPAIDAHPDDGKLEVYLFKTASKLKTLAAISQYTNGNYRKIPDLISHYSAKRVSLSSGETMCMSIDGELFYGASIEYSIIPRAVSFVCPGEISLDMLPRFYNRPEEGLRGER